MKCVGLCQYRQLTTLNLTSTEEPKKIFFV